MDNLEVLLQECLNLVRQTGLVLMDFWRRKQDLNIQRKKDGSEFTRADLAAHQIIVETLQKLTPSIFVLSEEGEWPEYEDRKKWSYYWLVDPLDGTRGFINHLEQFSINIALIKDHQPVLGVIYAPASETVYYAVQGGGAFKQVKFEERQPLKTLSRSREAPWRIVIGQYSRGRRLEQMINHFCEYQLLHVNGSVKFGWLADGEADLYPRLGSISEWDTAAGQCILDESGGTIIDFQGRKLQYNQKASLLNPEFIALSDTSWAPMWLEILNQRGNTLL
jgi:3'(2'), 5'-bisphosphate nucleotidase